MIGSLAADGGGDRVPRRAGNRRPRGDDEPHDEPHDSDGGGDSSHDSDDGSGSDGGDDGRRGGGGNRRRDDFSRRDASARERWGPAAVRSVLRSSTGTFIGENGFFKYANERNEKEAGVLCAIVDSLLSTTGIRDSHYAIEVAVRRLVAVREADRQHDWGAGDALDIWSPGAELGTIDQRRRLRRDINARRTAAAPSSQQRSRGSRSRSSAGAPAASGSGSLARGGGGKRSARPPRNA